MVLFSPDALAKKWNDDIGGLLSGMLLALIVVFAVLLRSMGMSLGQMGIVATIMFLTASFQAYVQDYLKLVGIELENWETWLFCIFLFAFLLCLPWLLCRNVECWKRCQCHHYDNLIDSLLITPPFVIAITVFNLIWPYVFYTSNICCKLDSVSKKCEMLLTEKDAWMWPVLVAVRMGVILLLGFLQWAKCIRRGKEVNVYVGKMNCCCFLDEEKKKDDDDGGYDPLPTRDDEA